MSAVRNVRLKKFEELTGVSARAVEGKIREGVWCEGKHYRYGPDGKVYINLMEYDRWVEGDQARA